MTPLFKKLLKATLICVGALFVFVILFFGVAYLCEYRPDIRESVLQSDAKVADTLPDTITILTWNIGYAGLGDNMDFFYDGGVEVRDSRERTEQNLTEIIKTLLEIDADVILLQEVDLSSHRTYGIHEVDTLRSAFPQHYLSFAYNYKALFVPIPLRNPIGRVGGGVVTLSRYAPLSAERLSYPSSFPFPVSMFNLKRCLLLTQFLSSAGDTVLIANTHNSAFDNGDMRAEEMLFLGDYLASSSDSTSASIVGGDWNQYPPSYIPTVAELSNPYFTPQLIDGKPFEGIGEFVYDKSAPSMRYMNMPYGTESVKSLTDFFFVGGSARVISIETLRLNFKSSDHNPVLIRVCL